MLEAAPKQATGLEQGLAWGALAPVSAACGPQPRGWVLRVVLFSVVTLGQGNFWALEMGFMRQVLHAKSTPHTRVRLESQGAISVLFV